MIPAIPLRLLVFTLLTMAAAVFLNAIGPATWTKPEGGFHRPILALEFVDSPEQFSEIVQNRAKPATHRPGLPIPDRRYASTYISHATVVDFCFIAAYGLLWCLVLVDVKERRRRRIVRWTGAACTLIAVIADCVENAGILLGLRDPGSPIAPATLIRLSASIK